MYGVTNNSSDAISRDMNSLLYSSRFKHPADGEFAKIKQLISPDPYPNNNFNYQNQSSLSRYRSTPSSFLSNLLTENGGEDGFTDHEKSGSDAREFVRYAPSLPVTKQEPKEPDVLDCATSFRGVELNRLNVVVRQNSTPAGFLTRGESGFGGMKKSTLNNHISFSSGPSSSPSRFLPKIAENKNELHDSKFSSLKRSRDGVLKMPQNGETGNHTPNLVHHMSLPKTSSEMAVVDNILQFQQESTVPWKTRAKRGCATHPRSIAERVRRTRISERIKRLQELFPDIDKHSNTADMLDMAVEYIKNLQKELQTLNDARARCKCSSK